MRWGRTIAIHGAGWWSAVVVMFAWLLVWSIGTADGVRGALWVALWFGAPVTFGVNTMWMVDVGVLWALSRARALSAVARAWLGAAVVALVQVLLLSGLVTMFWVEPVGTGSVLAAIAGVTALAAGLVFWSHLRAGRAPSLAPSTGSIPDNEHSASSLDRTGR